MTVAFLCLLCGDTLFLRPYVGSGSENGAEVKFGDFVENLESTTMAAASAGKH